jgi:hypothetical protein
MLPIVNECYVHYLLHLACWHAFAVLHPFFNFPRAGCLVQGKHHTIAQVRHHTIAKICSGAACYSCSIAKQRFSLCASS